MRIRWVLLTAAALTLALAIRPNLIVGQSEGPLVPPLPSEPPADSPADDDAQTRPVPPLLEPQLGPQIESPIESPIDTPIESPIQSPMESLVEPPVEATPAPSLPPAVIETEIAPPHPPAGPLHDDEELPPIVRPRYGSVLTNGAYMPVPVPALPAGTMHWQPGGREGRVGSPNYYTAPGQNGPLYAVHQQRGVPWGYNHSVFEYHFGPGYYRHSEAGHYRFPYYTYRAPWYSPGPPIYNRFTNLPW
jgi:hypothetical protein